MARITPIAFNVCWWPIATSFWIFHVIFFTKHYLIKKLSKNIIVSSGLVARSDFLIAQYSATYLWSHPADFLCFFYVHLHEWYTTHICSLHKESNKIHNFQVWIILFFFPSSVKSFVYNLRIGRKLETSVCVCRSLPFYLPKQSIFFH